MSPHRQGPPRSCRECGATPFIGSDLCFECGRIQLFGWRAYSQHVRHIGSGSAPYTWRDDLLLWGLTAGAYVLAARSLLSHRWVRDALSLVIVSAALFWSRSSRRPGVIQINRPPDPPTLGDRVHEWLAGPVMQNALGSTVLPLGTLVAGQAIAVGAEFPPLPFTVYTLALVAYATTASFVRLAITHEGEEPALVRRTYVGALWGLWLASIAAAAWHAVVILAFLRWSGSWW